MTLFLLRHAEAEDVRTSDFERELTPKGEAQARRVGHFCEAAALRPELILFSPLRRTVQTAELVAAGLGGVEREETNWLASGMNPETGLAELRSFTRFERLMLVGHEPDLGLLAAALLGISRGGGLHVRKAALMSLACPTPRAGAATLDFFLPVQFM